MPVYNMAQNRWVSRFDRRPPYYDSSDDCDSDDEENNFGREYDYGSEGDSEDESTVLPLESPTERRRFR